VVSRNRGKVIVQLVGYDVHTREGNKERMRREKDEVEKSKKEN
jgi:hypothetical protein